MPCLLGGGWSPASRGPQVAIERCHALRLEVGSYALMHGSGFELMDMFLTAKFAEGDSRILQLKLARDRLKRVQRGGLLGALRDALSPHRREALAALALARRLAPAGRDPARLQALMDANWREVYALADLVAARHIEGQRGSAFLEPVVERLWRSDPAMDWGWKTKLKGEGPPPGSP